MAITQTKKENFVERDVGLEKAKGSRWRRMLEKEGVGRVSRTWESPLSTAAAKTTWASPRK